MSRYKPYSTCTEVSIEGLYIISAALGILAMKIDSTIKSYIPILSPFTPGKVVLGTYSKPGSHGVNVQGKKPESVTLIAGQLKY